MDRQYELYAIEAIKQLKARYWRAVDMKDEALLRAVFGDGCCIDFRGAMGGEVTEAHLWRDADIFCADMMSSIADIVSVHHGFPAEIAFQSTERANAVWPMEDFLWNERPSAALPFRRFHGWGHYHDEYRLTAAGWRIMQTRISRIRIEVE